MPSAKTALLIVVLLAAALLLAEGILRLVTPFPIHSPVANSLPHPALGAILNPALPGIDAAGFRNPENYPHVEVVAIGDSNTYGVNVRSHQAWPYRLAEITGKTVYNFGRGGYGILQYMYLFHRALDKTPRHIVLALYLANDLSDYCKPIRLAYWRERLSAEGFDIAVCGDRRARGSRRRDSLWLRSAVGSAIDYLVWRRIEYLFRWIREQNGITVRYGSHTTYFTRHQLREHLQATDRRDARIREAIRVTRAFLDRMAGIAAKRGVGFGVLFVPSKQNVMFESADAGDPLYGVFAAGVEQERALRGELQGFLSARGVATANPLACLQGRFDRRLYYEGSESHPLDPGYRCFAQAAVELVD